MCVFFGVVYVYNRTNRIGLDRIEERWRAKDSAFAAFLAAQTGETWATSQHQQRAGGDGGCGKLYM